tara:strand:- start:278 stop:835 length:558 start_codon:yes stop_codon:yes gene_type:complete
MDKFMHLSEIPESVCNDIVDFYWNNDTYPIKKGEVGGRKSDCNDIKDSYDVCVATNYQDFDNRIKSYLDNLNRCLDEYFDRFDRSKMPLRISPKFNIQRYEPKGGYKVWHHERTAQKHAARRHLVWMTYLTDNPDGGTEFMYQDLYIPAQVGKTVIWPAEWMYTHRSRIDMENEKMIITGWVELI